MTLSTVTEQVSEHDRQQVQELLGREPRGLEAIAVRNDRGEPSVIRVASVVDKQPFPTLFWLVDREISYKIDQLEANGVIAELQKLVDVSTSLQSSLRKDHRAYIEQRIALMAVRDRSFLVERGYFDELMKRGIGGIADFGRIRCLHTHYAAHLVKKIL